MAPAVLAGLRVRLTTAFVGLDVHTGSGATAIAQSGRAAMGFIGTAKAAFPHIHQGLGVLLGLAQRAPIPRNKMTLHQANASPIWP